MPTAARLTAAIFFGIVGYLFAQMASPYFPEAREPFYWYPLNVGVGAVVGWIVCGSRAGSGYSNALANGLTTGVGMLFWVYFLFCFHEMIRKSLRKSYDGPIEAVVNVFQLMLEWGEKFMIAELGILMAVGSVVAALITEFVGRRYS